MNQRTHGRAIVRCMKRHFDLFGRVRGMVIHEPLAIMSTERLVKRCSGRSFVGHAQKAVASVVKAKSFRKSQLSTNLIFKPSEQSGYATRWDCTA